MLHLKQMLKFINTLSWACVLSNIVFKTFLLTQITKFVQIKFVLSCHSQICIKRCLNAEKSIRFITCCQREYINFTIRTLEPFTKIRTSTFFYNDLYCHAQVHAYNFTFYKNLPSKLIWTGLPFFICYLVSSLKQC